MRRSSLAKLLVAAADNAERDRLLRSNRSSADERLAAELRDICYASWTNDPVTAQRASAAANVLGKVAPSPVTAATAQWINGIAEITRGRFERAVRSLRQAGEMFALLGRDNDAAQTRVAELLALAMPGRYDEAVAAGEAALDYFVRTSDHLAAGKVAMNLGNVVSRQGRHRDAEAYGLAACRHFKRAGESAWLAMAENGLANTYAELNQFAKARRIYEKALAASKSLSMTVTEAEIEANLGNLAVLRGQYSEAIRYLEGSRQRYIELDMPHQSAVADLEIADIYSELNLLSEAAETYRRIVPEFARLRLRAEEARARLRYGRTVAALGDERTGKRELQSALRLFKAEGNCSGQVAALLDSADVLIRQRRPRDAQAVIATARAALRNDDDPRHEITLKLLDGRALAGTGSVGRARRILAEAEHMAADRRHTSVLYTIRTELGKLAVIGGDLNGAAGYFQKAIRDIESLRSTVGADEFSVAFLGDKAEPFDSLAQLQIGQGRLAAAFRTVERARSRALLDAIGGGKHRPVPPALQQQLDDARSRLNRLYRAVEYGDESDVAEGRKAVLNAERSLADLIRRVNSLTGANRDAGKVLDIKDLQRRLGRDRSLIEYIEIDGVVSAFVVDGTRVRYVRELGSVAEIHGLLDDLKFQFETLRYGGERLSRYAAQMKGRADHCLKRLYDLLLSPLVRHLAAEKLVIVPAGVLHYVPFHALNDGQRYLIESYETVYAPSAAVWARTNAKRPRGPRKSLIIGYADERIPQAEREAHGLAKVLPDADVFTGKQATFEAFTANAGRHGLIHLACHGQFRPDSPMFSSLHLADGWVTVQDICSRRINASLVTLSACETGVSKIAAGDELLGLVRGFLAAGASSMIVSLWTVNDRAASEMMKHFYSGISGGLSPAAALREAQLQPALGGEHPYFWSPFIAIGR
ncbi:MAG: CHAT domain-containing protein [Chloracidobacterium sp.]|nr:CHAT domain-containing protein [Chloracidobacterium sp.]